MKVCCLKCFSDSYIKEFIDENGENDNCNYCGAKNIKCITPEELQYLFDAVVSLYTPVEDFMPLHDLKEKEYDFIWEKLDVDWGVFDLEYSVKEQLFRDIYPECIDENGGHLFLHSWVENEDEYWGSDNIPSNKMIEKWNKFCKDLIYENRYFPVTEFDLEIISELLSTMNRRLSKGEKLFRARKSLSSTKYKCNEMGKPLAEISTSGRANPKGISYLYLASDNKTAMSEVRPFKHDYLTIGTFDIITDLYIIDLSNPIIDSPFKYGNKLKFIIDHLTFLKMLENELSKTVNPFNADLQYIPLQYLCELIKKNKYDGVKYASAMGSGFNYAIFNDVGVKCISTEFYYIENVEKTKFKYSKI